MPKRCGLLLAHDTVLKADRYPVDYTKSLGDRVVGAPNFRGIPHYAVYGVAQPTVDGIHALSSFLSTATSSATTVWICLREEPFIYVNGKPYVLRNSSSPLQNIDSFTAIDWSRLEKVEERLVAEAIAECTDEASGVLQLLQVSIEDEKRALHPHFVLPSTIATSRAVFSHLTNVRYYRVPISSCQAPAEVFIDDVSGVLSKCPPTANVIFSCGMGIGRTTLGMIIGCIFRSERKPVVRGSKKPPPGRLLVLLQSVCAQIPDMTPAQLIESGDSGWWSVLERAIAGDFLQIRSICRVLENGPSAKALLDEIIEDSSAVVDLRELILKNVLLHQFLGDRQPGFDKTARYWLGNYAKLLCFASFRLLGGNAFPFSVWLNDRQELLTVLTAIQKDPLLPTDEFFGFAPSEFGAETMLLKEDAYDGACGGHLRFFSDCAALGQPSLEQLSNLLAKLSKRIGDRPCAWINVREEPVIYLDSFPFVLRDQNSLLQNLRSLRGIKGERIEALELRLIDNVKKEIRRNGGFIQVLRELNEAVVKETEEVSFVKSMQSLFERQNSPLYFRLPITAEQSIEAFHLDALMSIVTKNEDLFFIVNCRSGRGRSTVTTITIRLILDWIRNTRDNCNSLPFYSTPLYPSILALIRILPNGLELKNRLDSIIDEHSHSQHLSRSIAWNGDLKTQSSCFKNLRRYFLLLSFEGFLDATAQDKSISFSDWFSGRPEMRKLFSLDNSQDLLIPIESQIASPMILQVADGDELSSIVHSRNANVLAQRMILKHDHFLGCQRISLSERFLGAPNFRQSETPSVFGIGMPTTSAIASTISRLGEKVLWVCLREEPVIFLAGEPFVLRFLNDPIANLEITGIVREHVEAIEDRLRLDVLSEIERYNGRIVLHDEQIANTSCGYLIVPSWKEISADQVQTPREAFAAAIRQCTSLIYHRIPITDEQPPLPGAFDEIFSLLWQASSDYKIIFNCQMGRGRTTTGMVIASIILRCKARDFPILDPQASSTTFGFEESIRRGNLKIIMRLLSLLEHGRQSKLLADHAINACSQVQNLREAIWVEFFAKHPPLPSRSCAVNYIVRYFYLILFSDFCIDQAFLGFEKEIFSNWLKSRKDICCLLESADSIISEI